MTISPFINSLKSIGFIIRPFSPCRSSIGFEIMTPWIWLTTAAEKRGSTLAKMLARFYPTREMSGHFETYGSCEERINCRRHSVDFILKLKTVDFYQATNGGESVKVYKLFQITDIIKISFIHQPPNLEQLNDLRLNRRLSEIEISKIMRISKSTVHNYLRKYDIVLDKMSRGGRPKKHIDNM
jgi:hypothetical protein